MINNKNKRLVHGKGINDAGYVVQPTIKGKLVSCPFYQTWTAMLARCYSIKFQTAHPTYLGCTVCKEWLSFVTFKAWMTKQNWDGKELDKDIFDPDNKIYSPETCVFVPRSLNLLLTKHQAKWGKHPIGVCFHHGRYYAQIHDGTGAQRYLGRFDTPQEASKAYNTAKSEHIKKAALEQTDPRIILGLLKHAKRYEQGTVK